MICLTCFRIKPSKKELLKHKNEKGRFCISCGRKLGTEILVSDYENSKS